MSAIDTIKKVSILGAGRSGIAAARFCLGRGMAVFISDICGPEKLLATLKTNGLQSLDFEADGHTDRILDADCVIVSPGVAATTPALAEARRKGIKIWSEIELAFMASAATFVAITGSAGKSTTVSMIGAILDAAGTRNVVAGNIGVPLISVTPSMQSGSIVVAEVSSFQLEHIDAFHPYVAGITNLQLNHLDRHADAAEYFGAKKQIIRNMTENDIFLLNAADGRLTEWEPEIASRMKIVRCGDADCHKNSVWHEGDKLLCRTGDDTRSICSLSAMKVVGSHNADNAAMAAAAAMALGIGINAIAAGLTSFTPLEHRLELAGEKDGVQYYNDSKSTTAESVLVAVTSFSDNVHLIAGGKDKGCDFSVVTDALLRSVKSICLIGEAADRMAYEWRSFTPMFRAGSLDEAVAICRKNAVQGDVVVMSPGCASFDMFKNYEHRGDEFKRIVANLV